MKHPMSAPEVPAEFWADSDMREALASQHMGRVIRAYRTNPMHGRRPLPQEVVAAWAGLSQGQLSKLECGAPIQHLDRLNEWARLLRIPQRHLWFVLPPGASPTPAQEPEMRRREALALSGALFVGAVASPILGRARTPYVDVEACARALAWELWRGGRDALHPSELPAPLAQRLVQLHASGLTAASLLHRHPDGRFGFAHATLIDVFVAQRIFTEIAEGDDRLFATAQTRHDTDQIIRSYVQQHDQAPALLNRWMARGASPVLRVNAAGVLAKMGDPVVGDRVISSLRGDAATRELYLTAVIARVAAISWAEATLYARNIMSDAAGLPEARAADFVTRFSAELTNPRDHVARWCSTLVLAKAGASDVAYPAFQRALATEPCRENLRAFGAALSGQNPTTL